eukprot:scaffold137564_cov14-Tisochrysis_lutea.AAC.1
MTVEWRCGRRGEANSHHAQAESILQYSVGTSARRSGQHGCFPDTYPNTCNPCPDMLASCPHKITWFLCVVRGQTPLAYLL